MTALKSTIVSFSTLSDITFNVSPRWEAFGGSCCRLQDDRKRWTFQRSQEIVTISRGSARRVCLVMIRRQVFSLRAISGSNTEYHRQGQARAAVNIISETLKTYARM